MNRYLVEEILAIQGVALGGAEAGVADDAAQLFFCRAVGYACGSHYILFQHHRAYVVAAEAQACLEVPFQESIVQMCQMHVTSGPWTR